MPHTGYNPLQGLHFLLKPITLPSHSLKKFCCSFRSKSTKRVTMVLHLKSASPSGSICKPTLQTGSYTYFFEKKNSFIVLNVCILSVWQSADLIAIAERMATVVKHKILVLSGKGGVGKSTFSARLAFALSAVDFRVGLLDIDICGPITPKMLGLEGQEIHQSNLGWSPVYVESNLGVMSIGFMLPHPDEAVIWRGPRKDGISFL